MEYINKIKPKYIKELDVFLEKRRTRVYAGRLKYGKERESFVFEYSEKYIYSTGAIPLGPDIPLTKRKHKSKSLFKSFNDRIPSSKNPSYNEYCKEAGISPGEDNQIILLATIGRRGPSSFVFEPVFQETISMEELKEFRKKLGLTIREFAAVFGFSTTTIYKIELGKDNVSEGTKRLKILIAFPHVSLNALMRNGGMLHENKKIYAIQYLESCIK